MSRSSGSSIIDEERSLQDDEDQEYHSESFSDTEDDQDDCEIVFEGQESGKNYVRISTRNALIIFFCRNIH